MNETAAAKATAAGQFFVATAANTLAARAPDSANVGTLEGTASTAYQNIATVGPTVGPITTGTKALVCVRAQIYNATAGGTSLMSYGVTGDTTIGALDDHAVGIASSTANQGGHISEAYLREDLTAGSNTWQAKYRVTSGTGWWASRRISVVPF